LWKLCGLTEAQCAVVNTVFIEVLVLWIWFSYVIWQTRVTTNYCVYCVGEPIIWYRVWHDSGSMLVCLCAKFQDIFYFHILFYCKNLHCFNAYSGECQREWPCTCGVCNRSLSCIRILKVLLHTSQVF